MNDEMAGICTCHERAGAHACPLSNDGAICALGWGTLAFCRRNPMSLAVLKSRALAGMAAPPVNVEVHLANGLPGWTIVGLPDTEVREAKDRVRAALQNSGFDIPPRRIKCCKRFFVKGSRSDKLGVPHSVRYRHPSAECLSDCAVLCWAVVLSNASPDQNDLRSEINFDQKCLRSFLSCGRYSLASRETGCTPIIDDISSIFVIVGVFTPRSRLLIGTEKSSWVRLRLLRAFCILLQTV